MLDRRDIPAELRALLRAGLYRAHSTVQAELRDGATFRWATTRLEIAGATYAPALREVGEVTVSLGSAADRCEFTLVNLSSRLGLTLMTATHRLDRARVVVGRYFESPDSGASWHVVLLRGVVVTVTVEPEQLRVGVVSPVDAAGALGDRPLTRHCQWAFGSPECGYTPADGETCSKRYDDDDGGCAAYNNQSRFGGFFFAPGADAANRERFFPDGDRGTAQPWTRDAYETPRGGRTL